MHNWIDHFKMQFHQLHASGHISKDQLVEMVNEIQSKKVFPVHTEINKYSKPIATAFKSLNKRKPMQCRVPTATEKFWLSNKLKLIATLLLLHSS